MRDDALELWRVAQKFTDRGQWQNNADYKAIQLGSANRMINYGAGYPRLPALTFAQAKATMADALSRLPTLPTDEREGRVGA